MWIITACQHISPETTVKGFKKCYISNVVDETDDVMLWNDSEEDRNKCEEDENNVCEDRGSKTDW
jgi:protein tyrosine phosphatase